MLVKGAPGVFGKIFFEKKTLCWDYFFNMMTSSNENIFRVTGHLCGEFTGPGEFPTQRPVTRSFDVYFDLCPNKRLSKQWWGWWFETLSCSLWRHRNESSVCKDYIIISLHWPLDRRGNNFISVFFKLILWVGILSTSSAIGLRWVAQNSFSLMIREWLGAGRHLAITPASVDPYLCRHMEAQGHNALTPFEQYFIKTSPWTHHTSITVLTSMKCCNACV